MNVCQHSSFFVRFIIYIGFLLNMKKLTMPSLICAAFISMSLTTPVYAVDKYGQDVEYKTEYAQQGCSELAWNQMVTSYNSKVNTANAQAAKLNQGILEGVIDPTKLATSGCLGDAKAMYDQVIKNAKEINNAIKSIQSANFKDLFTSVLKGLGNKLLEQACKTASQEINKGLNQLGANKYLSQMNNLSKDPLGYVLTATGADQKITNGINNALGNEWGGLVNNEVKQGVQNIGKR